MRPAIAAALAAFLAGCLAPAATAPMSEPVTLEGVTSIEEWCPGLWQVDPPVDHRVLVARAATAAELEDQVGERVSFRYQREVVCHGDTAHIITEWRTST